MSFIYPGSLHNHTEYSNLRLRDAISRSLEMMEYAGELGHKVIAFTEHESVSNALKLEKEYKQIKVKYPDLKMIRGNEIYLCRDGLNHSNFSKENGDKYFHFILLAKDAEGHKQIRELSTRAWKRSYRIGKMTHVPTYYQDLIEIIGDNPGHVIGSSACFLPGAMVKTRDGEKAIENITNQDYVLTHTGEWQRVNYPTSREYNDIGYEISTQKTEKTVKCTKNHKFYVYNKDTQEFLWKEAEQLTTQDYLAEIVELTQYSNNDVLSASKDYLNVINYRKNKNKYATNYRSILSDQIKITNELMRLFGLWLADGHITNSNPRVGFTFSEAEFDNYYNSFVKKGLRDLGLSEDNYVISRRPKNHRVDLAINSMDIYLLFESLFGLSHANNKYIPKRLLHISQELDANLWFGYMLGDGYFRYREGQGGEVVAASISKQLITDLNELSLSLHLSGSITTSKARVDRNNTVHQESYYFTLSNALLGRELNKTDNINTQQLMDILQRGSHKKGRYANIIQFNNVNYRLKKVTNKQKILINEKVYCLNVDNHSFTCQDLVVHNCLGSFLGTKLLEYQKNNSLEFYNKIKNWLQLIENIFGKQNFYLEMQPSNNQEQIYVNTCILQLSQELNIPYIITTDTHYLKKEDRYIHKAYLNSQDGEREVDAFYETTYMMGTEELESFLTYLTREQLNTAYQNILNIASVCEDYELSKALKIPSLIWRTPHSTDDEVAYYYDKIPALKIFMESSFAGDIAMAKLIVDKLNQQNELCYEESFKELNDNLMVTWQSSEVNKVHWSAYFLNLQYTLDECWKAGTLVGPGRGSGVGFYLLYILDIIQINCLKETTKCFSWRFLNPERVSVLDIDTDIEGGKRAQVLQHLRNVYGEDRIANVVTFGTEAGKSAIQTAARGLNLNNDDALSISALIPSDRGIARTLKQCYYGDKENGLAPIQPFVQEMNRNPELWQIAQRIEGLVCRVGEHAGGVIFVDEPFTESTALMRVPNGDLVTQFDLHDAENVS